MAKSSHACSRINVALLRRKTVVNMRSHQMNSSDQWKSSLMAQSAKSLQNCCIALFHHFCKCIMRIGMRQVVRPGSAGWGEGLKVRALERCSCRLFFFLPLTSIPQLFDLHQFCLFIYNRPNYFITSAILLIRSVMSILQTNSCLVSLSFICKPYGWYKETRENWLTDCLPVWLTYYLNSNCCFFTLCWYKQGEWWHLSWIGSQLKNMAFDTCIFICV